MLTLDPGFDYWTRLLPAILLFSVGLSMTVAPLTSTVLADAGESDAGIASGVNNAIARIAGLLGIAIVGVAAAGGGTNLDVHGYRVAMAVTAALIGVGGVIGLAGYKTAPSPKHPHEHRRHERSGDRLRPHHQTATRGATAPPCATSRSRSRPAPFASSSARRAGARPQR